MSSPARSIAFVIDVLEVGGIQRQLLVVCRALARSGWGVTVISLRSDGAAMATAFAAAGARVILLGKRRRFDLRATLRLHGLLRRFRPAVVHAMTPQAALWCAVVLRFLGSRPAFLSAFLNTYAFEKLTHRLVERWVVHPRLDAVLVNSQAAARIYRHHFGRRVPVACIHNGVEALPNATREAARSALGITGEGLIVGTVARLVPVKGIDVLLQAFAQVAAEFPDATLVLIGDGPLRRDLEAQAHRLGLQRRVVFHGEDAEPRRLLPALDLFVLPSRSEGFPNALLEALVAGLPCVASRVGGIPELGEGSGVVLVEPENPGALAGRLRNLLADGAHRRRLSAEALAVVSQRFAMNRMVDRTLRLYRWATEAPYRRIAA